MRCGACLRGRGRGVPIFIELGILQFMGRFLPDGRHPPVLMSGLEDMK